jgi:drug/metabolite transporter (DMT)-like permease
MGNGEMGRSMKPTKIWLALIALYITWGSTYLAMRVAVETIPPFLMVATRFLVAGGILYIWQRLAGEAAPTRRQWRSALIVGFFLLVTGNGMVAWAEQRVVSGVAALMVGTVPMWMVLIDAVIPGSKRPGKQAFTGVILGFGGIAFLFGPVHLLGITQKLDPVGMAALLLAGISWAIGALYSRDAQLPSSPLMGTGMEMLVGGLGSLLLGTVSGEWSQLHLPAITAPSILGLAYLIIFGSLVGFSAFTWLLRNAPTPLVSTYAYVNPLIAIFLGNLLASEPLTPRILLSALVIVSAVVLINSARAVPPKVMPAYEITPSCGDD